MKTDTKQMRESATNLNLPWSTEDQIAAANEIDFLRKANSDIKRIAKERNRLEAALKILLRRHEEETIGGETISGEEWEIASYALPNMAVR